MSHVLKKNQFFLQCVQEKNRLFQGSTRFCLALCFTTGAPNRIFYVKYLFGEAKFALYFR